MSFSLHQLALIFYNFSSVLCLRFENGRYQVSKWQAILNLIKFPIVSIFVFYTSFNYMAEIFQPSLVRLDSFSAFAKFSVTIVVFIQEAIFISLYILFFLKRHDVQNFMNNAVRICPKGKHLQNFRRLCIQNSLIIASIFFLGEVVQYFGAFNVSFATFLISIVYSYPFIMLFAFASFTKAAESFISSVLIEFRHHVTEEVKFGDKNKLKKCEKMSVKYKEIYDLSNQFNDTFGLIITSFVTLGSSLTVFNVI